ncbi:hypothetical protein SADUNF_Sadunf16G0073700 [Salix dunnii]|uniref:Uncharacterized protein n=1 Tax=Salix dunnii TaxID=1413687 RepID=A0A835MGA3_9ROSI|nr:hypothetical protein SADUNF_Sadunf16G0073700 [Salix dunnii]
MFCCCFTGRADKFFGTGCDTRIAIGLMICCHQEMSKVDGKKNIKKNATEVDSEMHYAWPSLSIRLPITGADTFCQMSHSEGVKLPLWSFANGIT